MSTTEIRTELDIDAPPSAVWTALTDFDAYAAWNPTVIRATGDVRVGGAATLHFRSSFAVELTFQVRITKMDPERELRWVGRRLGIDGDHYFRLAPTPSGTHLVHGELFTGPLARAVGFAFRRQIPVFEAFNRALGERAAGMSERSQ